MTEPVARTVKDFCRAYGVGKTRAFELIKSGALQAVHAGRRTLILESSAKQWLENLILLEKPTGKSLSRRS